MKKMKNLFWITATTLLVLACSKDDDPIFKPENLREEQQKTDTVYTGLDAMATDNGYPSMQRLLEEESWHTMFEKKFLIRNPTDTFYHGTLQAHSLWRFQFEPWPFNTSEILRNTANGNFEIDDFEPFPNRFEVVGKPDFFLSAHTRYADSTLSFELKRETIVDSITTVEYLKLQTGL